jgi:hypothetical protein
MRMSVIAVALAVPAALVGQNEAQIQMMDDAQEAKDDLLDAVEAKSGPKAAAATAKIVAILQETEKFWAEQKMPDIVKLAQDSIAATRDMEKVAKSGDMTQAREAYNKVNTACQGCHNIHPENRLKK